MFLDMTVQKGLLCVSIMWLSPKDGAHISKNKQLEEYGNKKENKTELVRMKEIREKSK